MIKFQPATCNLQNIRNMHETRKKEASSRKLARAWTAKYRLQTLQLNNLLR